MYILMHPSIQQYYAILVSRRSRTYMMKLRGNGSLEIELGSLGQLVRSGSPTPTSLSAP